MKKEIFFLIVGFLILNFIAFGQSEDIANKVLQVYKDESLPYLKKFSSEKYSGKNDDTSKALVYSQFELLVAKTDYIAKTVKDSLKRNENGANDKSYVAKLTSFQYGDKFPGLPKDFWESVDKKLKDL